MCSDETKAYVKYQRTSILRVISYVSGHERLIFSSMMTANDTYKTLILNLSRFSQMTSPF